MPRESLSNFRGGCAVNPTKITQRFTGNFKMKVKVTKEFKKNSLRLKIKEATGEGEEIQLISAKTQNVDGWTRDGVETQEFEILTTIRTHKEINSEPEKKDPLIWEPEIGEAYWSLNMRGEVIQFHKMSGDGFNAKQEFGNVYKTEELAQLTSDLITDTNFVMKRVIELNGRQLTREELKEFKVWSWGTNKNNDTDGYYLGRRVSFGGSAPEGFLGLQVLDRDNLNNLSTCLPLERLLRVFGQ